MAVSTHIVIACSYLHVPGGYEKAMITTANLFAEKGHRVTLLILDETAAVYYPLDKNVSIVHRPMNFGITEKGNTVTRKIWLGKDIRKLKQVLKELNPSYLICTEYPFAVAAIAAGAKKMAKVFSWEHHHYGAQHMNAFWRWLSRRAYRKLDAVICLNKDEQQHYLSLNKNATVIPNFIDPLNAPTGQHPGKRFSLITVTRFNHIKGIDLLMATAKIILHQNPELKWKVIGYGEQKDIFLDFIRKENLSGQLICQPADKPDINDEYRDASVFVLTSRNECFPLVLLEAMNNGLPCISFDCDTGPRHIIQQDKTGLLVAPEDINGLATAISGLIKDEGKQKDMSQNALLAVRSYYPGPVYALWEKLFNANH